MTREGQTVTVELDGCTITLETGRIARQAEAAVVVRARRTTLLVAVVAGQRPDDPGFLPLTVEYREKAASAGRIPGSFPRREGRISDDEIVASRILDRSIRPLFPKGWHGEVQVAASVLSSDDAWDEAPLLALLGACAALHLSSLPWDGPLAGLRLVRSAEGGWRAFPSRDAREASDVDLIVSGGKDGLVMVEGALKDVPESVAIEALEQAQARLGKLLKALDSLRELAGRPKTPYTPPSMPVETQALVAWLEEEATSDLRDGLAVRAKQERGAALKRVRTLWSERARERFDEEVAREANEQLRALTDRLVRNEVLDDSRRLDGRGLEEIRAIDCEVDWLASPHGAALFTRGETQAMVSCTLASQRMEQTVETLAGVDRRRFLLHYNFPPYSVGEARPMRGPGRREIGHGTLARRALEPVLPKWEDFPFVLRIESDISESNGSSSMATACGGCLALMDAGVPIKSMVAGIAMGLISDGTRFRVLSDILGDEDHLGDMDFKVTGTREGITALQMDNKIGALPREVLEQALEQARRGRIHILDEMAKALDAPREEPKAHAPRVVPVRISTGSIGDLVGPRGANIKEIEATFGVQLTIDEASGRAFVYATEKEAARGAVKRVQLAAGVVEEGRLYRGRVTGVKDFGAFVEIFKSAEGLVHVSEWDRERIEDLNGLVQEGDEVLVRVKGVDGRGKLSLSRRDALDARGEDIVND